MSDRDIEQIADAYLVDPDDRLLDDARYDPLAADTADLYEPCPRCDDGWITIPDPTSSAYFPKPDRTYRCPDCNGGAT